MMMMKTMLKMKRKLRKRNRRRKMTRKKRKRRKLKLIWRKTRMTTTSCDLLGRVASLFSLFGVSMPKGEK
jgi:hypothetical protein